MNAPTRPFGPARLAAAVLVAAGLAYLRFAPGDGRVSVPAGARAGQLLLHSCTYATEDGRYAADCGTLVVPENRHRAGSRLIALPVTRVRARSAHPGTPVFRLQGGPGITNMTFRQASRFADRRDVVLVGYRGVDGSSRLDCPEVASAREHAHDLLTVKAYRADAAAFRDCADRLRRDGVDLAGYTLPERVDDLDAARRALGYPRVDLLSESAGTRTALIYAWRYPGAIHRSVMLGVNPPGHFLWDARTTGEQLARYAALCRRDASCRGRAPDLSARLHTSFDRLPDRFWFLPVRKGNVRAAAFFGLMNATPEGGGPLAAPRTIDTLLSAGDGDGSGAWLLSVMAQLVFPRGQVWGDVAAVGRSDAAAARRVFAAHADRGSTIGSPGTDLVWAGGRLLDAWPASPDENEYTRVRDSQVETLLVGGRLDVATPPQWAARELLPHLPNGRQVLLPGLGHTDDLWSYEPAASSRLIGTFLASGRIDTSLYPRHRVDFTPAMGNGAIALVVVGALLGLAGLAVLSLLWLPLRLLVHGPYGPKGSAAVRTLYAPLLGLGGWSLGALLVLTALPGVPLGNDLLAGVSVGPPVGVAVFCAWFRRDVVREARLPTLGAALAAGLVGAWLGWGAVGGVVGVLTAAVGATVGANLVVLVLDVARDRAASARAAAPAAIRLLPE